MAPLMRRESAAIPAMPSPGSLSCRSDTLGCVGTLPCRWCTHWPLQDAGADASGCELWRMMRELRTQQVSFTFWDKGDLLWHATLVWRRCVLMPLPIYTSCLCPLIFGLSPFARLYFTTLPHSHSVTCYGNNTFDLRPRFEEHNWGGGAARVRQQIFYVASSKKMGDD